MELIKHFNVLIFLHTIPYSLCFDSWLLLNFFVVVPYLNVCIYRFFPNIHLSLSSHFVLFCCPSSLSCLEFYPFITFCFPISFWLFLHFFLFFFIFVMQLLSTALSAASHFSISLHPAIHPACLASEQRHSWSGLISVAEQPLPQHHHLCTVSYVAPPLVLLNYIPSAQMWFRSVSLTSISCLMGVFLHTCIQVFTWIYTWKLALIFLFLFFLPFLLFWGFLWAFLVYDVLLDKYASFGCPLVELSLSSVMFALTWFSLSIFTDDIFLFSHWNVPNVYAVYFQR